MNIHARLKLMKTFPVDVSDFNLTKTLQIILIIHIDFNNFIIPTGLELMKTFRVDVGQLEADRQELANAEKLFDLPITMYPNLLEVQKQMKGLEMVYALYEEQRVGISNKTFRSRCTPTYWRFRSR